MTDRKRIVDPDALTAALARYDDGTPKPSAAEDIKAARVRAGLETNDQQKES